MRNPKGQLLGADIPSGVDSDLYGTSRRRDSSVPDRTRLRSDLLFSVVFRSLFHHLEQLQEEHLLGCLRVEIMHRF